MYKNLGRGCLVLENGEKGNSSYEHCSFDTFEKKRYLKESSCVQLVTLAGLFPCQCIPHNVHKPHSHIGDGFFFPNHRPLVSSNLGYTARLGILWELL